MDATHTPGLIEQAAAWLAALDVGTADPQAFEAWRAANPAHAAAFAQVAAVWHRLDAASPTTVPAVLPLREAAPPEPAPARSARLERRDFLKAASLVAALGGGAFGASRLAAREAAETGVGERRSIVLRDGSRVDLNTDSRIEWRAHGDARLLWLARGEIALHVAAAADPFRLADATDGALLGAGRYNARRERARLDILVLAGGARAQSARAGTGEWLRLAEGGASARPARPADGERAEAWPRGELLFAGEPLGAAVDEFNRDLKRKLVVADPTLADIRLGGRFTAGDAQAFVAALNLSFGVVAQEDGRRILLRRGDRRGRAPDAAR